MTGFDFGIDRLVIGLFTGLTYGLLAVGLVLVYRSSRFVNFAHGSIGAFGASVLALFVADWGLPYWASFVVAILIAALLSGLVEVVVVRRLEGRPSLVGMIATLGLSQLILVMSLVINSDGVSGFTYPKPTLLPTFEIQSLPIGTPYVAMLVLAPVLLAGLGWFLRHHRMGMAIRAAADDPDIARLEGIPARWMATLAWTIAGGIAAFSAILVTPTTAGAGMEGLGPDLLLKGLAGAVIARMSSIPIAIAASLGIGVIEQLLLSNPDTRGLVTVVIAVIIVVALLRQPQLGRAGQDKGRWRRVVLPPLPEAYRGVRSIVWLPRVSVALGIAVAVGLAYVVSNDTASVLTLVAGYTLVGLSVGLLTGVSGQLSLGQFAYAGIAAAASVHVADSTSNFLVGLLCGVLSAAVASALVGIPAMRLKGLALAVSTLAFALATSTWLLRQGVFLGDGIAPAKPTWWDYPLEYAVDYYLFALLMLCIGVWVTNNLRHGGFGRMVQALRDNEHAARAFTVPNRMRMLQLYAVSGGLAGLGGIVIGHGQSQLTVNSFPAAASIDVVAVTVVGGLTVTLGPLIGALIIVGLPALVGMSTVGQAALAVAWLLVVIFLPDGIGGVLVRGRDLLYDGLARRHGIDPLRERHGVVDATGHASSPLHERPRLEGLVPRAPAATHGAASILTVDGVSRRFGGVVAVDHVGFEVAPGEILGVIGPNGAGKTTCFEIVAGFTRPDRGRIVFDGIDVTSATPEQRAREGLVRSFQDAALFPTLTVHETLMVAQERVEPTRLWTSALGVRSAERDKSAAADEVLERMRLTHYARHAVGELSTGTRRVVELACLLTLEPRVLLLDEPSAGIAQSESDALGDLLLEIREELGTTMVVIEHDLPLLSRLSDRMIAMNLGRVIATGTPDEVRTDPAVVTSYLGADQAAIHRSGLRLAQPDGDRGPDPLATRIQPVTSR
ncbi:branched-chain amino acid ABC transporter permease/ATP-binding protein [Nocardioides soli]|uniref:ABC-type branched-subunit amino acid transport system ATPase component/ABC-type branched-subunit amino acid transport system permease subunit n=1 Tax=Nocardioides soli TaxID=1036020 RepID=A0A7W4VY24_9ACTN|nr:branched-chain amino acid ABC transporter permease/ATP-binding protein [Nocardioides soli]MBB3043633.1 ABC-type branched-subunit amino acid transport system ATPase component/ABC-type branched-subunit amino acid transport system permease subunit [Nocardioides soli]